MVQENQSGSATIPVLLAIVSTVAVCVIFFAVYNIFVVKSEVLAASNSGRSTHVDAALAAQSISEANQLRQCKRDAARTAALLRALAESRDGMACSVGEDETVEGDEPADTATEAVEVVMPSEEEILAMRQAKMDTLEQQLANEPDDEEWAIATEEAMANALAAMEVNVALEEVTCRQTFCRAQMTHNDPSTRQDDINRLMLNPDLMHQMVSYSPPGEEGRTVMYFPRKGHSLSVLRPSRAPKNSVTHGMESDISMPPERQEQEL